jgi:acetyltransferase EpsM
MVYILGAGGHTKQVIDILDMNNTLIDGIFDDDIHKKDKYFYKSYKVLDTINNAHIYIKHGDYLFCGIGDNATRRKIYDTFSKYIFINVVSPLSHISPSVHIGTGNYIGHFVNISADSTIGNNNIVNDMSCITHDVVIGDHNHICPGAILSGRVKIGDGNLIGTKANVNPDMIVSSWNIVGSAACVTRDILDDKCVVVGVPGCIIRRASE